MGQKDEYSATKKHGKGLERRKFARKLFKNWINLKNILENENFLSFHSWEFVKTKNKIF